MNGIIPQVDKWTSGWVHNNCVLVMGLHQESHCLGCQSVLPHHQIQFSGESILFHFLILTRSFSQLVADCSCKKIAEIATEKERERERGGNVFLSFFFCFLPMDTNPTKILKKSDKKKGTHLVCKHHQKLPRWRN